MKMSEGEGMRELKIAERCLKEALKEKNKECVDSLMFQFCKQMERAVNKMAGEVEDKRLKTKFKGYANNFGAFSKIYKKQKNEKEKKDFIPLMEIDGRFINNIEIDLLNNRVFGEKFGRGDNEQVYIKYETAKKLILKYVNKYKSLINTNLKEKMMSEKRGVFKD